MGRKAHFYLEGKKIQAFQRLPLYNLINIPGRIRRSEALLLDNLCYFTIK